MKTLKNQNGTSLIGVVVALGLTALLVDMIVRLSYHNSRVAASARIETEINSHVDSLKQALNTNQDLELGGQLAGNGFEVSRIDKTPIVIDNVPMIQYSAIYKRSKTVIGSEYVVRVIGSIRDVASAPRIESESDPRIELENEDDIRLVAEQIVREHAYIKSKRGGCN